MGLAGQEARHELVLAIDLDSKAGRSPGRAAVIVVGWAEGQGDGLQPSLVMRSQIA